jgi:hypothetical protein
MEAEVAAIVAARGWSEHVRLHGRTDNAAMPAVYRTADLTVNCSLWPENEPLTLLESLASGAPAAATRIGGNTELIEHGVNGWLYPPGSAAGLAEILAAAAADPAALNAMRPAARASVASRTIAAYADFALAAYEGLSLPTPQSLPSIAAVFGTDLGGLDGPALWRASKTGYWSQVEWLPADAVRGDSETAAVTVALSLDGRLDGPLARALPSSIPVVVLGPLRDPAFSRFERVRSVPDLEALAELGLEVATHSTTEARALTDA